MLISLRGDWTHRINQLAGFDDPATSKARSVGWFKPGIHSRYVDVLFRLRLCIAGRISCSRTSVFSSKSQFIDPQLGIAHVTAARAIHTTDNVNFILSGGRGS